MLYLLQREKNKIFINQNILMLQPSLYPEKKLMFFQVIVKLIFFISLIKDMNIFQFLFFYWFCVFFGSELIQWCVVCRTVQWAKMGDIYLWHGYTCHIFSLLTHFEVYMVYITDYFCNFSLQLECFCLCFWPYISSTS